MKSRGSASCAGHGVIRPGETAWQTFGNAPSTHGLIFKEKEIFVFALLQWSAIALGNYLWVQPSSWIPQSVWKVKKMLGGSR